nr:MAG TPA: deoxyribosyltransferase [Caudoviricetes sp.]
MNIYISGPIEGVDNYREKFERAKRIIEKGGHKAMAINPVGLDLYGLTREQILNVDLALLDLCDTIYMLKGWESSCGANREYGYALAKGMDIMFEME